jgi:ABC-type branched-subunit amino acid transport system permease subunit
VLPLLDDSYIGVIAQRAYIYWILSAGLNLVVGYAGQIAIGWVSMLTLGAYTTAA